MLIRMKADANGCHNGTDVRKYINGEVYPSDDPAAPPMSDDLAKTFIEGDLAEEVDEKKLEKKVVKPELKQGDPAK